MIAKEPTTVDRVDHAGLPPLKRDPAFWGMTVTQLLGAFNDSVFKQIVLLICLSVVLTGAAGPSDQQFVAQAVFALAFILFSGVAGYWSDRITKRSLIVLCKAGEIAVMALATLVFFWMQNPELVTKITVVGGVERVDTIYVIHGMPWLLLFVLFLMGTQSAIFGPAKYGILPEMVRSGDLPKFNGAIQLTTFLSLILGIWVGGVLLEYLHDKLWAAGLVCVGIAALGTATSFLVRRTPIAQPGAPFRISAVAVAPETWRMLKADRPLQLALLVYSVFWFVAAILPMAVNWLGVYQFRLNYADTSFLLATTSIGIALGFVLAGWLSRGTVRFGLVRWGSWGLIVCLILMAQPAGVLESADVAGEPPPSPTLVTGGTGGEVVETIEGSAWRHLLGYRGSQLVLIVMGFCAGLFALPVQVFLQSRPPDALKGRMIGTMNLVNWIAIIISAMFYGVCEDLLGRYDLPKFGLFAIVALLLAPIALFYRPADVSLQSDAPLDSATSAPIQARSASE